MDHSMSVKTKYYNLLKSGVKTIELRLFDDKRKMINVGDEVVFYDSMDPTNLFNAIVVKLHKANNFEILCSKIQPEHAGFNSKEELIKVLREFYPLSRQNQYGVIGIEIKLI